MSQALTDDLEFPRITPAVQWVIAINVAIYFLQVTLVGSADMQRALGFELGDLTHAWWTIVTHMFVHGGFWHLALNMYTLYLFGRRVEHAWSAGEFARYYVLCGLGGWLAHLVFARGVPLIGASAAVFGVMLAYAVRWPNDEVYLFGLIPMRVKWLVAMFVGINLVGGMTDADQASGVAYLAHLGGLATGWLYLRATSASGIGRLRERIAAVPDLPDEPPRAIPRTLPRAREKAQEVDDIVAKSKAAVAQRPIALPPVRATAPPKVEDLNVVLDKISEQGLDSLSADERRLLEDMSRRLRGTS